jgi:hypothetical protein
MRLTFSEELLFELTSQVKLDESRLVRLRTDLVPFLKRPEIGGSTYLLVYSIEDSRNPSPQLITGFPVADGMVKFLTAPKSFGENISITTHYNGFVQGLTGKKVMGLRRLE